MKEGYWVTRTYQAGEVREKSKFFVPGTRPTGNDRRREKNAIRKQEQNEYSAVKALARLIHANFTGGDLLLGLDYSPKGYDRLLKRITKQGIQLDSLDEAQCRDTIWETASHELYLCLRRVKDECKKQGIELKAISCTSDMDGETGECVRVHHHLLINREAMDAFVKAWKKLGGVDYTPLYKNQVDRTPIAEYIIKQVRRIPDKKKYHSTRNLERPKPKDRIALSDAELRLPKGGTLLYRAASGKGQPQYIRYTMTDNKKPGRGTEAVYPEGERADE